MPTSTRPEPRALLLVMCPPIGWRWRWKTSRALGPGRVPAPRGAEPNYTKSRRGGSWAGWVRSCAHRAVATCYDKRDYIYRGTITVAAIIIWLRDPVTSQLRDTP